MNPRALSIKQPWAWAIVTGNKDIENRSRVTHLREPLLIHAGLRFSDEGFGFLERHGISCPSEDELPTGALVGMAELTDCVKESGSPWGHADYWHWILSSPLEFRKPIDYPGSLGFFRPAISSRQFAALKANAIHHRKRRLPK